MMYYVKRKHKMLTLLSLTPFFMPTPFFCIQATQSYNRKIQCLVTGCMRGTSFCQAEYVSQAASHLADGNTEAEADITTVPSSPSSSKK